MSSALEPGTTARKRARRRRADGLGYRHAGFRGPSKLAARDRPRLVRLRPANRGRLADQQPHGPVWRGRPFAQRAPGITTVGPWSAWLQARPVRRSKRWCICRPRRRHYFPKTVSSSRLPCPRTHRLSMCDPLLNDRGVTSPGTTRALGDTGLAAQYSLLLCVPSAVVGPSFKRLFTLLHAQVASLPCRVDRALSIRRTAACASLKFCD